MQLSAKLIELLPVITGEGKNGPWKKQNIIVETDDNFPKKICFTIWGDKVNPGILKIGELLNISFDIESREYNGKWYTDAKAWKVESASSGGQQEYPPFNENDLPQPTEDDRSVPF